MSYEKLGLFKSSPDKADEIAKNLSKENFLTPEFKELLC